MLTRFRVISLKLLCIILYAESIRFYFVYLIILVLLDRNSLWKVYVKSKVFLLHFNPCQATNHVERIQQH